MTAGDAISDDAMDKGRDSNRRVTIEVTHSR
jgi:hypothetical protein